MAAVLLMLGLLGGCSRREVTGAVTDEPRGTARGDDIEKIVNVYSWADYIAPDTVSNFEKETGIKVHYDVYDNNEILETKLLSGHSNYDVVVPTDVFFDRQREAGVYRKLDKQALPNLVNTDPQIMRQMAVHDPGNLHAIPYMWSTTGIGYNVDMVRKRLGGNVPDSWALLFDPRNAAKLQDCGILIVDSPLDVFGSAIIYLHRDPQRRDPRTCLPPRSCCTQSARSCAISTRLRLRRSRPGMCASSSHGRAMWKPRATGPSRPPPARTSPISFHARERSRPSIWWRSLPTHPTRATPKSG
jgi:spermidine/putrescine-binding protein